MAIRHDITLFMGQLATIPETEFEDLSWKTIVALTAPEDGPALQADKARGRYALPGLLQVAPYTGKTLERAIARGWNPLTGKQRSAAHSTGGSFLKFDLDDVDDAAFATALDRLRERGLAFVCYSTHSHGKEPGLNRARVLIPLDRHAGVADYQLISAAAAHTLLGRSYDPSEHRPYQLFGIWMAHPDRADKAFRHVADGEPLSCDDMLDQGAELFPARPPARHAEQANPAVLAGSTADVRRLNAAIPWIVVADYTPWVTVMTSCAALAQTHGVDTMVSIAEAISGNAPAEHRTKNGESAYSPRQLVETMAPTMPPAAATGVLLGMAKTTAADAVRADKAAGAWSQTGRAAAKYLATHHPRLFDELRGT
jgi:hypothetical protein